MAERGHLAAGVGSSGGTGAGVATGAVVATAGTDQVCLAVTVGARAMLRELDRGGDR